jgi:hypothetical protein
VRLDFRLIRSSERPAQVVDGDPLATSITAHLPRPPKMSGIGTSSLAVSTTSAEHQGRVPLVQFLLRSGRWQEGATAAREVRETFELHDDSSRYYLEGSRSAVWEWRASPPRRRERGTTGPRSMPGSFASTGSSRRANGAALYGIASSCRLEGEAEQARSAFEAFMAAWSGADPDRPEMIAAREALAAAH